MRKNKDKEASSDDASTRRSKSISILFLIGMAALGFLAQFQVIGQVVITLFAVYALITRVSARKVYAMALLMLGMVPLAILLGNWLIAQNFAAYSFLAFVYGIFIMTAELNRELKAGKVKDTTSQR
jgi:hypothetical protein